MVLQAGFQIRHWEECCRIATYREASFIPFVIAAMIFLARVKDYAGVLKKLVKE